MKMETFDLSHSDRIFRLLFLYELAILSGTSKGKKEKSFAMAFDLPAGGTEAFPQVLSLGQAGARVDPDIDDANVAEDETLVDALSEDEEAGEQLMGGGDHSSLIRRTTRRTTGRKTGALPDDRITYAPRLPWRVRLGYSVGEVGIVVPNQVINFFKNVFLLDVARLPPDIVGIVLLVSTLWDACTDILFGMLSDSTKSSIGRRRPYILLGSIVYAAFFYAFWQSPNFDNLQYREVYYFFSYFFYKTCSTLLTIPYYALVSELTSSYSERTFLTSLRSVISSLFALAIVPVWTQIANAFPLEDQPDVPDLQLGYAIASTMCIPIIVIPSLIVFATVKEPILPPTPRQRPPFRKLIASVFANKPFLYTLGVFLSANLASQFVINNVALYVKYVIKRNNLLSVLILALQAFTILSIIVWTWVASRLSKHHTFMISIGFFVVPLGLSWLYTEDTHIGLVFLGFGCGGIGVGGLTLLPWTMMADCVDVDELATGIRREGLYFSLFVLFQKCALAGALAGANYALEGAGYKSPPISDPFYQNDTVLQALKIMIGPVPCGLALISLVPAFFYPLTREKHQQLTTQLNEQRRFRAATKRSTLATARQPPEASRSVPDLQIRNDEFSPQNRRRID